MFILIYTKPNVLIPNISTVQATIFISGLNYEKVKVKSIYLYYALRYKVQNILHSCMSCMSGMLCVQSLDIFHLIIYCVRGLLYMHIGL